MAASFVPSARYGWPTGTVVTWIVAPTIWFGAPHAAAHVFARLDLAEGSYLAILPELLFLGGLLYAPLLLAAIPVSVLAIRRGLRSWLVWGPGLALVAAVLCCMLGMARYGLMPDAVDHDGSLFWLTLKTAAIAGLVYGWVFRLAAAPLLRR